MGVNVRVPDLVLLQCYHRKIYECTGICVNNSIEALLNCEDTDVKALQALSDEQKKSVVCTSLIECVPFEALGVWIIIAKSAHPLLKSIQQDEKCVVVLNTKLREYLPDHIFPIRIQIGRETKVNPNAVLVCNRTWITTNYIEPLERLSRQKFVKDALARAEKYRSLKYLKERVRDVRAVQPEKRKKKSTRSSRSLSSELSSSSSHGNSRRTNGSASSFDRPRTTTDPSALSREYSFVSRTASRSFERSSRASRHTQSYSTPASTLRGGDESDILQESLPAPDDPEALDVHSLAVGAIVKITGLRDDRHLEGRVGRIKYLAPNNTRLYYVELIDESKDVVGVDVGNLEAVVTVS